MNSAYDLIIIGAGPAGLSASIYASRYGIKHLILGKSVGGTVVWAHKVDNYPGLSSILGSDLAQHFLEQAQQLGGKVENREVSRITKDSAGKFLVSTLSDSSYQVQSIIIATGTKRRELGIPGEKKFIGHGVSYCCTCDAAFYKGKTVAVIGGANAACSGATHVAQFARKVYLLYRRSTLKAEPAWFKEIIQKKNIEIVYETNVLQILGSKTVEKIKIDKPYQNKTELLVDGVFVEIGGIPLSQFALDLGVATNDSGYVITDKNMATNIDGIFSAGDVNSYWQDFQQVITAVFEGALAAYSAYKFLKKG